MVRPIEVEERPGYRILLRYSDGVAGEIDLSDVAGKGIFKAWDEPGRFQKVYIAPHRAIAWNDEVELCHNALYMELTGKSWEELPEEVGVGRVMESA